MFSYADSDFDGLAFVGRSQLFLRSLLLLALGLFVALREGWVTVPRLFLFFYFLVLLLLLLRDVVIRLLLLVARSLSPAAAAASTAAGLVRWPFTGLRTAGLCLPALLRVLDGLPATSGYDWRVASSQRSRVNILKDKWALWNNTYTRA